MTQNILYGGELSYFTGKARSYLRWRGVPFEERLATRDVYKKIIVPRVGYPMIPVLVTPDDTLIQDTTEIIDYFEAQSVAPRVIPTGPRQRLAAHLLELYGDEWLVIPAMHYRWAHNRDFAYSEFGKLALPHGSADEQFAAGKKAAEKFEGSVKFLGATPEMAGAIERSYEALLDELNAHFGIHDFLLGGQPTIADFGLIGPLYAHLYRDPASGDLMRRRAPNVARWVERMQFPGGASDGALLANDEIPETLLPILARQMREQGPCLIDIVKTTAAFKADNPDADIPRVLGMHAFTVEGETGQRIILPYTQWMLQRATAVLGGLPAGDQPAMTKFLRAIGGEFLRDIKIDAPVKRVDHQLVWA